MCDTSRVSVTLLVYVWHFSCKCDTSRVCVALLVYVWHLSCRCRRLLVSPSIAITSQQFPVYRNQTLAFSLGSRWKPSRGDFRQHLPNRATNSVTTLLSWNLITPCNLTLQIMQHLLLCEKLNQNLHHIRRLHAKLNCYRNGTVLGRYNMKAHLAYKRDTNIHL